MTCCLERLILLLVSVCWAASAQVTDFAIDTSGPHHVVQGHYMFFLAKGRIIDGTDKPGTVPSVSGLPGGATAEFVDMARFCCGSNLWSLADANPIKISTTPTTPVGTYPLNLTYATAAGIKRSTSYTLYVDALPTLVHKTGTYFPPDKPLGGVSRWRADMLSYGRKHCVPEEAAAWEGFVWYYDGGRVYYQIADATNDPSWNRCAVLITDFYRKFVLDNKGNIQGWRVFPDGLAMNYQRTKDPLSREAVSALTRSLYANWVDLKYVISWSLSREISYAIDANLVEQNLGGTPNPHLQDLVEVLLGDFDQWFVSKNSAYVQPFMVALASEALIRYWDVSHDPRIPPVLQMAADQMWTRSWETSCKCFRYYNEDETIVRSQDLNLLIVPLYGWVYKQTGFQGYRDIGDEIFNAGASGAWLDGGKQFSQSYRWSDKYLLWRRGL